MFDLIIANPPYNKAKDFSFLEKSYEDLNEGGILKYIMTSRFLLYKINTPQSNKYKNFRNKIKNNKCNITFINNIFNDQCNLFIPLCLIEIKKIKMDINNVNNVNFIDKRSYDYVSKLQINKTNKQKIHINHISMFGNGEIVNNIWNKIYEKVDTKKWNSLKNKPNNYYVSLSSITGNGYTNFTYLDGIKRKIPNSFSILNNHCDLITNKPVFNIKNKPRIFYAFETEKEAQNFLNFLTRTVFFRFLITCIKFNPNAAEYVLKYTPYFNFEEEWNDDKLFKYFNLTEEEIEEIYNIIKIITIND